MKKTWFRKEAEHAEARVVCKSQEVPGLLNTSTQMAGVLYQNPFEYIVYWDLKAFLPSPPPRLWGVAVDAFLLDFLAFRPRAVRGGVGKNTGPLVYVVLAPTCSQAETAIVTISSHVVRVTIAFEFLPILPGC